MKPVRKSGTCWKFIKMACGVALLGPKRTWAQIHSIHLGPTSTWLYYVNKHGHAYFMLPVTSLKSHFSCHNILFVKLWSHLLKNDDKVIYVLRDVRLVLIDVRTGVGRVPQLRSKLRKLTAPVAT